VFVPPRTEIADVLDIIGQRGILGKTPFPRRPTGELSVTVDCQDIDQLWHLLKATDESLKLEIFNAISNGQP